MISDPKMNRRAFLASGAILPIATPGAGLATSLQDQQRAQLLALITELENPPGYQTLLQCWTKAHIAGQLMEALGMEVPPSINRRDFARHDAEARETYQQYSLTLPNMYPPLT